MATTFYTDLLNDLNGVLGTYISTVSSAFFTEIHNKLAKPLLGIYIALWGWSMMRGAIQEPVLDGFTRIIRLTIIVALAMNAGIYNGYLSDLLWQTPEKLAEFIVNAAGVSGGAGDASTNMGYLDTSMTKFDDIHKKFLVQAETDGSWGIPDLTLWLTGWAIYVAGAVITAYCAFLLSLSKIALSLLLGIGPIFVLFLIFEPTKRFFETWMGQVLNYVFLVTLTAGAMSIILFVINGYFSTAGATLASTPSIAKAWPAIIFSIIGILVMVQVPSIASALGGGVAISTLGAAAAVYGKASRAVKGTASGAWNLASGKTMANLRASRRHKELMKRWAERNPGKTARASKAIYNRITGNNRNSVGTP